MQVIVTDSCLSKMFDANIQDSWFVLACNRKLIQQRPVFIGDTVEYHPHMDYEDFVKFMNEAY